MPSPSTFDEIRAFVQERFNAAVALQQESLPTQSHGASPDEEVEVTVDGRGFVTDIRFDDDLTEVTGAELRDLTLGAIRSAREALRPTGTSTTAGGDALTALHDDTVARAYDALLSGAGR
ncbi:hypothetical protein GCG21_07505 [Pseudactinotalea sp. HY160]|nr:hypothetical protein [Pseudactinotalea sp. HY160]